MLSPSCGLTITSESSLFLKHRCEVTDKMSISQIGVFFHMLCLFLMLFFFDVILSFYDRFIFIYNVIFLGDLYELRWYCVYEYNTGIISSKVVLKLRELFITFNFRFFF